MKRRGRAAPRALVSAEDERLIAAFLRGDGAAVEQVRVWLEEGVRRFRSRLSLPWEDVRQELLLEAVVLLRRGSFRGESRLRTYLWRVAKYRCLNMLRQEGMRQRREIDEARAPEPAALGPSPSRRVEERQAVDILARLMAAMPAECRELWAKILNGMSYAEMSRELGVAPGTLRVRVLRCRRKALALWEEWSGEPRG